MSIYIHNGRKNHGGSIMGPEMTLREANNNDAEEIKALVYSVLEEYGLPPDPCQTDVDLEDIESNYVRNNGYFCVVEQDGNIVATMGILKVDKVTCELRKMYSIPGVRGKGLGKYLLEMALIKARELGYRRMVLETASPLKEAISLYRKYGFRDFSPECIAARCDQAYELDLY